VRLLDEFRGVLQADGYSGYAQVCAASGLTWIGCWDHARRKFVEAIQGAHASATCYSLIETAKADNLEPSAYIRYVLEHIADADTLEKLERLLPWNVDLEPASKKVAQYR